MSTAGFEGFRGIIMREALLLGLLLTVLGLAGVVMSRGERPLRAALLVLFSGVAVMCLAASAGIAGDIAAAGVLLLGGIFSLTGDKPKPGRDVP